MKYIDADLLMAEIEGWYNTYKIGTHGAFRSGKIEALRETIELIDSLRQDQPEVDIEEEINKFFENVGMPVYWCNDAEQREFCSSLARHFYELGLNDRKEKSNE